ncbi:sensor histidine kinase [Streptomyces sp. WAC06614]|uniref:sensor histidine kinase n=1 Tax=Streptomyces sp. WAC06614 TaxID=2487416 RepID=UPI000F7AF0F1|nr:histidine kinase [Streptomyces sp. WAC06614]RSS62111.1 two-component sensor histidine kinase [Streptomyces sp. WAC06614]
MNRFVRAPLQGITYTRWVHLLTPVLIVAVWMFIEPEAPWFPALIVAPFGLIPWVRVAEGLQAQFLLLPSGRAADAPLISTSPSARWGDRWRTVLWLEMRLVIAFLAMLPTVWLPAMAVELVQRSWGLPPGDDSLLATVLPALPPRWLCPFLVPVALVLLWLIVVLLGQLTTAIAGRLLGPSAAERMTQLEKRTEDLLERNRIARELHDSIGHALTVAVMQAGAARAAGDPAFTERALAAIEETGRAALEDLERVLLVLRESAQPPSQRPTLREADRLLESARSSGAEVDAELSGPLEKLPGPITREGYRILQEALTNVLRHCGPVPVRVRVEVGAGRLDLEVTNPLPEGRPQLMAGTGSGLRGMRERAALLGGKAESGPHEESWRVRVRLPLERIP